MALKHQELIDKMTLEEKCSLLSGFDFWQTKAVRDLLPSAFLSDGPSGLRKQAAAADHLGLNPSIPAVCMPSSATIANSFNPEMAYLAGKTIGEEMLAADVSLLLGPGVNMKRNPRCGRNFEYYSEDPYLAGKMAVGFINGVQANGAGACLKHFAANNQEIRRMMSDSIVDERALREIYLTAFEIAVKEANPKAVMSSYNRLNGTYANENIKLLKEILRDEWGYEGMVVSDWGGNDDRVKALKATSDLEMPTTCGETDAEVVKAVKDGSLNESYVNESVDRIIDFVLSTKKDTKRDYSFDKEEHHKMAQKVAEESLVLLKNKDNVLPLKEGTKVAIIGNLAKQARFQGAGSSIVNPFHVEQVSDVIGEYPLEVVGYAEGYKRYGKKKQKLIDKAVEVADKADVLLVFVGLDEVTEAEGFDRHDIRIPGNQRDLIAALYHVGKPIVIILECGSPVELPFLDRVDALLHAYLPGEAGVKAIFNILTGKVNPSGKLAESYPFGYMDCPSADHFGKGDRTIEYRESIFIGYRYYNTSGVFARFPFGYGLSYTSFKYSDLKVSEKGVSFKVANVGEREGKEITQLYIGKKDSFIPRPKCEFKGFQKVTLKPGESKEIFIPFDEYSFRYWNRKSARYEIEGGVYQIYVGPSSVSLPLEEEISIKGTKAPVPYDLSKLPLFTKAQVRRVSDEEFEELLGYPIPEKGIRFIKKKRILVDYNTPTCDLKYSKGWTGRLFEWAIRFAIKLMRKTGHRMNANTLVMGVYYNPTRAYSRMGGGVINYDQLDGLIMMFNGKFFGGLHHFFKAGRKRKKAAKAAKKAAKEKAKASA